MKKRTLCALTALVCAYAGAATNYDLLGRKASKMNSPMVYKNVDYKKKNSLDERQILMRQGVNNASAVEGIFDEDLNCSGLRHNSSSISAAVITTDEADYFKFMNKYFTPVVQNSPIPSTAKVLPVTNTSYTATIEDVPTEDIPLMETARSRYEANFIVDFSTKRAIESKLLLSRTTGGTSWFYSPNSEGSMTNNTGVYLYHRALPTRISTKDANSKYIPLTSCSTKPSVANEMEVAKLYNAITNFAAKPVIYGLNSNCQVDYPASPESYAPQIYMGVHTDRVMPSNTTPVKTYSVAAKRLDNYIYNNHTTEIVAAGNFGAIGNTSLKGLVSVEAQSANAIAVGAVNADGNVENYSSYANTSYGASKPEIVNLANYRIGDYQKIYDGDDYNYSRFDGTQSAAAVTASMVTDLLSEYPFYRWHPEVVKAYLLTSSIKPVTSNPHAGPYAFPTYQTVMGNADDNAKLIKYTHYSRFWNGDLSAVATTNSSGNQEIRFTVKVEANATYRAAIAWLSSGNDIANLGSIPQDFDLSVHLNNNAKEISQKISSLVYYKYYTTDFTPTRGNYMGGSQNTNEPYEVVEFNSYSDGFVTFVITLFNENSSSENVGKVQLGFDLLKIPG